MFFKNRLLHFTRWQLLKNLVFVSVGAGILVSLYFGFYRLLSYLDSVELIGPMLSWKLTGMVFLITFAMITVSSLIVSMTTLYYSKDLKFLFSCPIPSRMLFTDKAADTVFYSSWTLMLAILPYIAALIRVKSLGLAFFLSYLGGVLPFIMLAASFGMCFSMIIMWAFPSSRTRDITWVLGSLSVGIVYVLFRFSKPERLLRPDALEIVAQYINYLQSPTASYLPSWWLTKSMMAFSAGNTAVFAEYILYLYASAFVVYSLLVFLSGKIYPRGFSGAQSGARFAGTRRDSWEMKLGIRFRMVKNVALLMMKDRKLFLRDARYWSQMILILSLIMVYLFSIKQLPLDNQNIKSLVSFLNVGVVGFVISAISLRFVFPSISMEGDNFWLLKTMPVKTGEIMAAKLLVSGIPTVLVALVLVAFSNSFLEADPFISALTFVTIVVSSAAISVLGIGIGAVFPDFSVDNIHQIESSYGGFLHMACSMGYMALIVALESWPVQMHFAQVYGKPKAWDFEIVAFCAALFVVLNALALILPWKLGVRNLEKYEI